MKEIPQDVSVSTKKRNPHLYQIAPPTPQQIQAIQESANRGFGVVTQPKPAKRIRQSSKPLLNKLEQAFRDEVLRHRFSIIEDQAIRFRLGNGIWYKPDFVTWPVGFESQDVRMRAFEVKGPHAFRGGFENLKVAATRYPLIKWTLVWKEQGQWKEQLVLP